MKTINEQGLFNNYATEPAMYYAEYPSAEAQRNYALQGAIAVFLITALFLTALSVG